MIKKIYSSLPSFKTLSFNSGVNILLADKTDNSSEKSTRNGAGKSSLVEIVHFLLGGSCGKESIFRTPELINYSFSMLLNIEGYEITVSRAGSSPSKVRLSFDPQSDFFKMIKTKNGYCKNTDWKIYLGALYFNINADNDEINFRSIFPYFARKQYDGGFLEPTTYFRSQKNSNKQIALSFLLGLDWHLANEQMNLETRKKDLNNLKKIVATQTYKNLLNVSANLKTEITLIEDRVSKLNNNIKAFKVYPEYKKVEEEASEISRQISDLSNKNYLDKQLIDELEKAANEEAANVSELTIDKIYEEVGLKLPDLIKNTYEDAKKFHEAIIKNRRSYLNDEIVELKTKMSERHEELQLLSKKQESKMRILNSHGALEQYNNLQNELNILENNLTERKRQLDILNTIDESKSKIQVSEENLRMKTKRSLDDHFELLKKAILSIEHSSNALYNFKSQLEIGLSKSGISFIMTTDGQKSKGITNMQIFCFDIMLIEMSIFLSRKLRFLIHDSHLFDGVDDRQIKNAIQYAINLSKDLDFQYIITMNSDDLPKFDDLDINDFILPVKLTDKSVDGGLFGIRF
ncbi:DUF2326 domain-containing protein [Sporolactobacillus shoreicorticis]|uniref:DUF2326 domain-containing protein n=1 Tax=Sporolactobacillus shoreicorticis TaxID=1923877 RepID=A0ABW5S155_9BACL|nr:DUF2326 domain-containing protein [Sporolactobacillus shoreicorticis]MCO7124773.1 DUF2326 domain-containing protein [Sporolactobacillus shoreicorticis]